MAIHAATPARKIAVADTHVFPQVTMLKNQFNIVVPAMNSVPNQCSHRVQGSTSQATSHATYAAIAATAKPAASQ